MELEQIKQNHTELKERIYPLFQKFCGRNKIKEVQIEIGDAGECYSEIIDIGDENLIVQLRIVRSWSKDENDADIFDSLSIYLHWDDSNEHLEYDSDYFPTMNNEAVVKKVSLMMKTALQIFNHDTFRGEEIHE